MMDASDLRGALAANGLHAVSITPVEIREERWVCLGFEEAGNDRGDFMHLALLRMPGAALDEAEDLYALVRRHFAGRRGVCTRLHSECLLGDAMGSSLCDCGDQLQGSLGLMRREGSGILVYLRQEGRGIGMRAKLDCLARQFGVVGGRRVAEPLSPDMANLAAGYDVDHRDYQAAAGLLSALGVGSVRLVTGNLEKVNGVRRHGILVDELIDVWSPSLSDTAWRELKQKETRHYRYARHDHNPAE